MDLETDNPEKGRLLQRSAHHREQLESEMKLITERAEKVVTNALIIGGALAVTYLLVSGLSEVTQKKKSRSRKTRLAEAGEEEAVPAEVQPAEAGIVSRIGAVLAAQAAGFLLSIAREKLVEFLQSAAVKKEQTNDHS